MTKTCFIGTGTVADSGGGIARVARLSIRALSDAGAEPRIVSLLDRGRMSVAGKRVRSCAGNKALFAALAHGMTWRSGAALYDALGVSRAHPWWGPSSQSAAAWIHGVEVWHGLSPAYRQSLNRLGLVFCNTSYTLRRHEEMHGPLPQAKVCWLATEEDDPPERAASFSGPPVALILARIDASEGMKGHDELIDRWASVISVVPGARLVIAGGGSGLASIKRMAGDSGAAHAIDVLGFVEAARIPGLLERAHVLAMPSRQEGFGVAYIEAMRFGLPCIASRHDGGQEVNLDGETGYNVNLGRRDDLTERLIELLSNPARAQEMGQRGHARWRAHFRYSQFSARFQQNWRDFMSQTETGHGA